MTVLRRLFARTAFRLCLVLWSFGYFVVVIAGAAMGRSLLGMLAANLVMLPVAIALAMGIAWLLDRFEHRHPVTKWAVVALAVIAAGVFQTAFDTGVLAAFALTVAPSWQSWALDTDPAQFYIIWLLYTWTFGLSAALIWAVRVGEVAKLNEARAMAFEAAASRAEAAALRLQLNPHFLFNTLNGIASLVVRRQTVEAEEMIGRLADFLRASLAADPGALVPLRQELATVQSYLHVEQARLGDRMRLVYAIDDAALDIPVPNFLLQPLIENAVKHGIAPYRRGGTIEVSARIENDRLALSVVNSADGRPTAGWRERPPRTGIGLANTRRRLQSLYGAHAWLKAEPLEHGYRCEIGLPTAAPATATLAAE